MKRPNNVKKISEKEGDRLKREKGGKKREGEKNQDECMTGDKQNKSKKG